MLHNYIKITLRSLWKNKVFSIVNILGLSIGMTCAFLLYLYVQDELSYDQYHQHKDRIYRLESTSTYVDQQNQSIVFPGIWANMLKEELPTIAQTARLKGTSRIYFMGSNRERVYPKNIFYTDPSLFEILTFKAIAGNLTQTLKTPNTIVLSRNLANQFFRSPKNALGKVLQSANNQTYTVVAVIEDTPFNSHFRPEAFISMSTFRKKSPGVFTSLFVNNFSTLVKLKEGANPAQVALNLNKLYDQQIEEKLRKKGNFQKTQLSLLPITNLHLSPAIPGDYASHSDAQVIYIFSIVALLIVIIACINYTSLSTARAIERAKEVGVRKVVGSHRAQLIGQFLVESFLISFMALGVSILLVESLLPHFNQLANKHLVFQFTSDPYLILGLLGIASLVGLFSGIYPAFVLSSFQPYKVLKGQFSHSRQGNQLRKGLVVFQFSISIVMIVSTLVVLRQMQYVRTKNLGFDKKQLYKLPFYELKGNQKYQVVKEQLQQHPSVVEVTNTSQGMDGSYQSNKLNIEQENGTFTESSVKQFFIQANYLQVMGIPLIAGRNLNRNRASDLNKGIIVNEAFQHKFGWKNPIGKKVGDYKVVGVAKNFHTKSLYEAIEPFALRLMPKESKFNTMAHFFVRLKTQQMSPTLNHLKTIWKKYNPKGQYNGMFVNEHFAPAYEADQRRGKIFLLFSFITIFIAGLGLFGLATFTTRQRNKEIGIRKVLGASVAQILALLSGGFVRLVLISSLIAFPLAYYFMSHWLQNFAYRTSIHWSLFLLAGAGTLLIALLTVSFQSWRAASVNPVEVLKDE